MTLLRKAMILAMQMRGFSPRTHVSYLAGVTGLANYLTAPLTRLIASR